MLNQIFHLKSPPKTSKSVIRVLSLVGGLLLLPAVFVWFQLSGPWEGAFLQPAEPTWQAAGVVVTTFESEEDTPNRLHSGDLVVAVEGRPTEEWSQLLFRFDLTRPRWRDGQTVNYSVVRDGHLREVAVTLQPYPFGQAIIRSWGVLLFIGVSLAVATFVFLRCPHQEASRVIFLAVGCWFGAVVAWVFNLQLSDLVEATGFWLYRLPVRGAYLLGYIAFWHFALIFPKPHPLIRRYPYLLRVLYISPYLLYAIFLFLTRLATPTTTQWLGWWHVGERILDFSCLLVTIVVAAQSYWRAKQDLISRQQLRWIFFALSVAIGFSGVFGFVPEILGGKPLLEWNYLILATLPLPVAFAFAILRYRLFDIDIIINRTLVYTTLSAGVIGLYVLVVGSLSTLFQTNGHLVISLLATTVVAVVFQPFRERLQRTINRLMYGERDDPYTVVARLGQRLEAAFAPEAVLPTIVETVAQALKLPYVEISLKEAAGFQPVAAYGPSAEIGLCLPLVYQKETLGLLKLAPRAPGEIFSNADQRLLEDLTRQVGVAVHAVRLTADLQRERERLVTAREEERRRLRRDLHDGHGPMLAALTLKVGAAQYVFESNPAQAKILLAELENGLKLALADIRRLVYNLRPPALDELGLVEALRQSLTQYTLPVGPVDPNQNITSCGLVVRLQTPQNLPPLPAAVEVAVYRIVQEGLTNVVRHAQAHSCTIQLSLDEMLQIKISDDGVGLPVERKTGVGLTSLRERAQELGGNCQVHSVPGGGTTIVVRLPLSSQINS